MSNFNMDDISTMQAAYVTKKKTTVVVETFFNNVFFTDDYMQLRAMVEKINGKIVVGIGKFNRRVEDDTWYPTRNQVFMNMEKWSKFLGIFKELDSKFREELQRGRNNFHFEIALHHFQYFIHSYILFYRWSSTPN